MKLQPYTFEGRITGSPRIAYEGPLNIYFFGEYSISIHPLRIKSGQVRLFPFHPRMLFAPIHSDGSEIVENGYRLELVGTNIGVYEEGGRGPDGDFDIFKINRAEIVGRFSHAGLSLTIRAETMRSSQICYSTGEKRDDVWDGLKLIVEFTVPPSDIQQFLGLQVSVQEPPFVRFGW